MDRNAVPSTFLRDVFARYGIDSEVVPNIVDVDRFAFRRREPLRPKLLSTRNFESLYNVACTLRAFRLVQDRYPDASLTLVGAGSEDESLRALAQSLQLSNVTFAGRVPPADIWRYYADADIYLQTPNIDNMPASVLEAFASGCAVVATNAGGVPAILTDGVHGLLVDCDDHEAAAARVLDLLKDPSLVRRLTTAARESCSQYLWELGPIPLGVALSEHGCGCPRLGRKRGPRADARVSTSQARQARLTWQLWNDFDTWTRRNCGSVWRANCGRWVTACAPPSSRRGGTAVTLPQLLAAATPTSPTCTAHEPRSKAVATLTHTPRSPPISPRARRGSRSCPALSRNWATRWPPVFLMPAAEAVTRADRMLQGRYDILGYRDVDFGTPPDWQRDPVHDLEPPSAFWSRVPYLDPEFGDHKIIWEINRHQHWLGLGRAYQLTRDRRYTTRSSPSSRTGCRAIRRSRGSTGRACSSWPFARSRGFGHCISSPRRQWMTPRRLRRGRSIFCSAWTGSRRTSLAICRNTSAPTLTCRVKRWQFSSPGSSYRNSPRVGSALTSGVACWSTKPRAR